MKRVHIHISGKVQGVGFRQFTVRNARRLGVKGWIRNLPDGRVEGMLEGEVSAVDSLVDLCREGPRGAGVTGIETEKGSPQGSFSSFSVKYG